MLPVIGFSSRIAARAGTCSPAVQRPDPAGEAVWIMKWVMSSEKGSAGAGRGVLRGVMPR